MWDPVAHYIYVTRDIVWLKRMYFNPTEPVTHNPIKAIDVPISEAGKNQTNETSEYENATQPATPAPTNAPSKLKVTVGNITFMLNEDEEMDNEDEWE